MKSLIWKQWRESNTTLAILCGVMFLFVVYVVAYELSHPFREVVGRFSTLLMLYGLVVPIWLAIQVSHGERAEGSISFTAALPVSPIRVGAVRLLGALTTFMIPVIFGTVLLTACLATRVVEQVTFADSARRSHGDSLETRATLPAAAAVQKLCSAVEIQVASGTAMLLGLAILGTQVRRQATLGFLGALIAPLLLCISGLFYGKPIPLAGQLIFGSIFPASLSTHWGYGSQKGSYTDLEILAAAPWACLLAFMVQAVLVRVFCQCYFKAQKDSTGLAPANSHRSVLAAGRWIPFLGAGRKRVLAWLELRQSVPLILCGLMLAVAFAMSNSFEDNSLAHGLGTSLRMNLPGGAWCMGGLWAAVVGSGVFASELTPQLGSFWRSRPIPVGMWFWIKFVVGLGAVLAVLDGLVFVVAWTAPREAPTLGMSWAYVACFPIVHAFLYALAVFGTCWLRRPVVGAIGALLSVFFLGAIMEMIPSLSEAGPLDVYNHVLGAERNGFFTLAKHGYPTTYGAMFLGTIGLALASAHFARPAFQTVRTRQTKEA